MPSVDLSSVLKTIIDGSGDAFLPVGAQVAESGIVYRIWAPDHDFMSVAIGGGAESARRIELHQEGNGYFSGLDEQGRAGDLYHFETADFRLPDPASRFQPLGVEGPSQVVDPRTYSWIVPGWRTPPYRGRVIYELHVGTFTSGGTYRAAVERLDALVDLGINTIELMPLADFAGERNWGYDGVMLFAPARCYGAPDELRTLVDAAHARGLAVVVDVVYNHLGPVGNVLGRYSRHYFHPSKHSPWGQTPNFDGPNARAVREFFLQNACMWFDEYHVDGLRLDALHAIEDSSPTHIAADIAAAVHLRGGFVIGEDERNDATVISPRTEGGWDLDGLWADDFHHTMRVALTHEGEAHYASYRGTPDEWLTTARDGWLFSGQNFAQWGKTRGTPAGHLPPECFVWCISNHDQVGNRPLGDRLHEIVSPEAYRALSMLLCLAPYTPMLFMGQEWATSSPFPYFTDHPGQVGEQIRLGRLAEYREKKAFYGEEMLSRMPDPQAPETFRAAKLKWNERGQAGHSEILSLYRACLQLRARESVFQSPPRETWTAELVGRDLLVLRWGHAETDWLLLFSLRPTDQQFVDAEIARPRLGRNWRLVLGSNEHRFGGLGLQEATGGENAMPVLQCPGAMLLRES